MKDSMHSPFLNDKKQTPHPVRANHQDDLLLHFLWQWKLASTSALSVRFYPERSPRQAYERLRKLERGDLIQCHSLFHGEGYAWGLTKRAFANIIHHLPALQSEGFLSEDKEHDLLVSAIHLGDWLWEGSERSEVFSEQQLRTYHPEVYTGWVPRSQSHRPDGYWYTGHAPNPRVIALEVELSQKNKSEYAMTGHFYDLKKNIDDVLWVVKRSSLLTSIQTIMIEAAKEKSKHSFVAFEDVIKSGWQAKISSGVHEGKTISELLANSHRIPDAQIRWRTFLDLRKSPHKSDAYLPPKFIQGADRMGILPYSDTL